MIKETDSTAFFKLLARAAQPRPKQDAKTWGVPLFRRLQRYANSFTYFWRCFREMEWNVPLIDRFCWLQKPLIEFVDDASDLFFDPVCDHLAD